MGLFSFPSFSTAELAAKQQIGPPTPLEAPQKARQSTTVATPVAKQKYYVQNFKRIRELGRSTEGTIELAREKSSGTVRVFKTVGPRTGVPSGKLCREARALSLLQSVAAHQNIIRMIHAENMPDGCTVMCLWYCNGGDLWDQMMRFHDLLMAAPRLFILHCLISVGEALAFIHHGFVQGERHGEYRRACETSILLIHRDIKPENIFLDFSSTDYGMPIIKLSDFGQADTTFDQGGGTTGYRSPEMEHANALITIKSDIYSMAVTMFELCEGFDGQKWPCGLDPSLLKLNKRLAGLGITDFLRRCLTVSPDLRLAMNKEGGLSDITAFRELREKLAKTEPIRSSVWNQKI